MDKCIPIMRETATNRPPSARRPQAQHVVVRAAGQIHILDAKARRFDRGHHLLRADLRLTVLQIDKHQARVIVDLTVQPGRYSSIILPRPAIV